jgi:hypothetical protein
MGIPDSPWQGRATSSERGSVEILDEWSANRKVSRNGLRGNPGWLSIRPHHASSKPISAPD